MVLLLFGGGDDGGGDDAGVDDDGFGGDGGGGDGGGGGGRGKCGGGDGGDGGGGGGAHFCRGGSSDCCVSVLLKSLLRIPVFALLYLSIIYQLVVVLVLVL